MITASLLVRAAKIAAVAIAVATIATTASADRISTPIAEFTGLDKITGRIINFDVYMNETVQFGVLQITPRYCYMRTPDEPQQTWVGVEINEVTTDRTLREIFRGWMLAESPALNAVQHAVYDVWLTSCKMTSEVPPPGAR